MKGTAIFIYIAILIAAVGGWAANIVKFVGMLGGEVTTMFIARIAGIFLAPLGVILGYY
jgi:hypothetical protein